ncbi:MAG: BlaI/MecI/CopY family transcriptional regulator [Christensenellales bacterium]
MNRNIRLSEGEWKIMHALWESAPKILSQIVSELEADTGWTKGTVYMMLSRLGKKGAVRFEEVGRSKLFYPVIQKEEAAYQETESFLSRVYGGSLSLLVASMAGQNALSSEEIDELYEILRQAERESES